MTSDIVRTFETRLHIDPLADQILHQFAQLFAHIRHRLFADIASGKTAAELKNSYLKNHQITARHFNALRVQVEGKISSIKQRRPGLIAEAKERISSLQTKIKKLLKKKADPHLLHQKKRRLHHLQNKLTQLQQDHEQGLVRCCFGSNKLFRAQFNLELNGYTSHQEWRQEWQQSRIQELFFLGSKDETGGNQTCTIFLQSDQTLQLRIRLPDALGYGKYLIILVDFTYGKQELLTLLNSPQSQAISYRLQRDHKGWRLFTTFDIQPASCSSLTNNGVIGLDINTDQLALVETDRFGNPISKAVIPFNLHGKDSHQALAIIGDCAASAVTYAQQRNKPLIIEELDFQKKKIALREERASYARTLSSFAYRSFITHLNSRASKQGVLLAQVNPAYTSLIGRIKFAKRYGLSLHQAAALVIGRRYLRCSEKVPLALSQIPDGKNGHVTLSLPVRNRGKHVWSLWRQISKKFPAALKAHFRTQRQRSSSMSTPAPETTTENCGCDSHTRIVSTAA